MNDRRVHMENNKRKMEKMDWIYNKMDDENN